MKTIEIPTDVCEYIERLQYESEARKDLLAFMIDTGRGESEAFKKYEREYVELYSQYQMAKTEMAKTYVGKGNAKWNLDFATHLLEIRE